MIVSNDTQPSFIALGWQQCASIYIYIFFLNRKSIFYFFFFYYWLGGVTWGGASIYVTPPTCASLLQPQPLEHLAELVVLAEVGQLDVHAGPQPCAQVGRTGEHVAQVLIPHELVAALLEQALDLQDVGQEEGEDGGGGE